MTWQLSAFTDEAADSIDGQIEAALTAKLKLVDLRKVSKVNITELPIDDAKSIRDKLDAAGLGVGMFGSPIGKIDIADEFDSDLKRLRYLAELSPVLGTTAVRIFSYYNKADRDKGAWQAETLHRLSELRDLARNLGLVLYHENERLIFGDLCHDVKTIADAMRDPDSFRMIFDFDNYNQSGQDTWECWQLLHDQTDAFHLKDSDADHQHVPAGQGAGQVERILADAIARGWAGMLGLEPHLTHSAAVMSTGAHGSGNERLSDLSPRQTFQLAADAAHALLADISAPM